MAEQRTIDADERRRRGVLDTTKPKEQMTGTDAITDTYADPQEPEPEMAVATLAIIVGSIFLVMIVVMIFAFMYFNNFNGAAG